MKNAVKIAALAVLLSGLLGFARAANAVIISDTFGGSNGDPINGRFPDGGTNLPGGAWYSVNGQDNPGGPIALPTIQGGTAQVNVNNVAYIQMSGNGFTKPTVFVISADLKVGSIPGNNLGVGLGFNDIVTIFDVSQEISLAANGNLNFHQTLIAAYNPADFGGNPFNPNNFYHLAYTVDTSTGGVSGIRLSNNQGSEDYTLSTNAFTDGETAYAGIFSNASAFGTSGNIDNFLITVPEPGSLVLLLGMGAATLVRRRRA